MRCRDGSGVTPGGRGVVAELHGLAARPCCGSESAYAANTGNISLNE
jgi:hypothetical protein